MFVYELSGCGFDSCWSHINFRYRVCFEQEFHWQPRDYRVWIHSKLPIGYDQNTPSPCHPCYIWVVYLHTFHVNFLRKRHVSRGHRISCPSHHMERADNKPISGLIEPRHMTTSRSCHVPMARCSPHVL